MRQSSGCVGCAARRHPPASGRITRRDGRKEGGSPGPTLGRDAGAPRNALPAATSRGLASGRRRWARALEAIARSGLTYSESAFDRERFEAVRTIAAEIAAAVSGEEAAALRARFADEYGYATPKVDVRGVVSTNGACCSCGGRGDALDAARRLGGRRGDPRQAVEKEVRQEAGLGRGRRYASSRSTTGTSAGGRSGPRTSTSCTCAATCGAASLAETGSRPRRRPSSPRTSCRSSRPRRRPSTCARSWRSPRTRARRGAGLTGSGGRLPACSVPTLRACRTS